MNQHHRLFGLYVPGNSFFHSAGVGWKYLIVLALTVPALLAQSPQWCAAAVMLSAGCLLVTRLPPAITLGLPRALIFLLIAMGGFQWFLGDRNLVWVTTLNVVAALYAARLLTLTTPGPVLIDALVGFAGPLHHVGLDPERFGLAVAVMMRSIPHLLGSFAEVRDAARARGLERNLFAQLAPVVVKAVAFAQATGEALTARGLGETREPKLSR
ncbi:MAG: energy-coupling factor transporter transmembrane protein EcfT [Micropruina sp.]|nr:energy-coupling factor transporter transmembrane protein EcfT [Micropruina sp.]